MSTADDFVVAAVACSLACFLFMFTHISDLISLIQWALVFQLDFFRPPIYAYIRRAVCHLDDVGMHAERFISMKTVRRTSPR